MTEDSGQLADSKRRGDAGTRRRGEKESEIRSRGSEVRKQPVTYNI